MIKKQISLSFGKSQAESNNSESESRNKGLAFGGVTIREDKDGGMISLTDLWKAAGGTQKSAAGSVAQASRYRKTDRSAKETNCGIIP